MKRFGTILEKHAGDVFLMFVFLYMAMRIYVDAYLHETMMSPDSCGYLREALNLAQAFAVMVLPGMVHGLPTGRLCIH